MTLEFYSGVTSLGGNSNYCLDGADHLRKVDTSIHILLTAAISHSTKTAT